MHREFTFSNSVEKGARTSYIAKTPHLSKTTSHTYLSELKDRISKGKICIYLYFYTALYRQWVSGSTEYYKDRDIDKDRDRGRVNV